ncbi:GNAT family N-acetyltransferase [Natrialba swarupiae]|uniref:GNAT family N-acetyltransferase n=1 Tax=Natrialba swarupiae TaxID=2448032 RepID=A0A5D5AVY5_9EURY|nr:GNAT family N-acetyltransferase [Natrialba swarupiae]TYT63740.1 GNAT family N-acetyltransferase [Natrialba swarupiae]
MSPHVRIASDDDALEVRRILDAAMLEPGDVEARIAVGDVLVAGDRRGPKTNGGTADTSTEQRATGDGAERILGTTVLEADDGGGAHVSAIGVRRRHRGRGIGTTLIERALEREGRLTVRFDDDVRPFYEALGFSIEPIDKQRYRGVVTAQSRR